MNYGASFYQNPPTTQESKIEGMLDHVLDGQQNLTMDYKGKIDDVYTNLNEKFEALSTHVKKLETARYPSQSTTEPTVNTNQQPQDAPKPMIIEKATERKFLMEKRKKNKVSKHLRRDGNEKEMKKSREIEEDIELLFDQIRENVKQRVVLKKKSDPGKFVVPCIIGGQSFSNAICDTGDDPGYVAACYSDYGAKREDDGEVSIDTQPALVDTPVCP
ncbi:hypothetical protein F2Q68_00044163 [Brassica cretica]|uniref:Uncharacterized protein n=1 Tax=Brassica cretica TaxID=69181 RepID=A0A8S9LP96_BRACR|nr:hypothetical protein F2Q68_00044163 [Brassica cretica]